MHRVARGQKSKKISLQDSSKATFDAKSNEQVAIALKILRADTKYTKKHRCKSVAGADVRIQAASGKWGVSDHQIVRNADNVGAFSTSARARATRVMTNTRIKVTQRRSRKGHHPEIISRERNESGRYKPGHESWLVLVATT